MEGNRAFRKAKSSNSQGVPKFASQTPSEDDFSEDEWLSFTFLGVMEASNSQIVVDQIQKEYEAKYECMTSYLTLVQDGLAKLSEWVVKRVPRTENLKDDALAKIVATLPIKEVMLLPIYLQTMSSIATTSIYNSVESNVGWMHDIAIGKWVEELPGVLWAYRTTPERPTGTIHFALAYGMEAIIPTEIGMPTAKTVIQGQRNENQELERHSD
ncbi:hypothetical protein CK203_032400 [Vitis vinifera]|uniref:RNase H type-1 domain-containing protein n=1 Tax=Vitis vinifera TaxID=29760 RepID=A0A438IJX4_VITVI|nr:hypothetical protein CK203_032400 [Vitis vinifera]